MQNHSTRHGLWPQAPVLHRAWQRLPCMNKKSLDTPAKKRSEMGAQAAKYDSPWPKLHCAIFSQLEPRPIVHFQKHPHSHTNSSES